MPEVTTIDNLKIDPADLPPLVKAAVDAIIAKKGNEIAVFDMREFTPFVDFHIITSADSAAQAKVILGNVIDEIRKLGTKLKNIEGDPGSGWVLIDFWDIVVHIFRPELRRYYNLEGLWADLPSAKVNIENDEM